ncbi:hypothetical protein [Paraliobacillus salinarum]|uniref:hypothetical protein n=1 Tax=Paraliobacillus salinarum TaxID=1158996 RepID=UPI0015F61FC6|nr:hypothetical protein [Paraliobacillus salinarum]
MKHNKNEISYLLLQLKRYKKLIKSYQQNDVSEAYMKLKQTNDRLTSQILCLEEEIYSMEEKINKLKLENKELVKENKQLKQNQTNAMTIDHLQDLLLKEMSAHVLSIYHLYNRWLSIESQSDKEVYKMSNLIPNQQDSITHKADFLTTINHSRVNNTDSKVTPQPEPFHFKDLKSYQEAYMLPEKKQTNKNPEPFHLQTTPKQIKKMITSQKKATTMSSEKDKEIIVNPSSETKKITEQAETKPNGQTVLLEEKIHNSYGNTKSNHPLNQEEKNKSTFTKFLDFFKH